MKAAIQNKFFDVTIKIRHRNHSEGKWEIKTVRVETKLDALAVFAAKLKLQTDYPTTDGWEFDDENAEVIAV